MSNPLFIDNQRTHSVSELFETKWPLVSMETDPVSSSDSDHERLEHQRHGQPDAKSNSTRLTTASKSSIRNSVAKTPPQIYYAAWALMSRRYADSKDIPYGILSKNADKYVIRTLQLSIEDTMKAPQLQQDILTKLESMSDEVTLNSDQLKEESWVGKIMESTIPSLVQIRHDDSSTVSPKFDAEKQEDSVSLNDKLVPSKILVVSICLSDASMETQISFDPVYFSQWQIENILSQFEHVASYLENSNGNIQVSKITLLSPRELNQILSWNWNEPGSVTETIPDMFARQVCLHGPDAAVASWDMDLTYNELNDLSLRLASYLIQECGVQIEDIISMCFDKSAIAVVAILAIIRAGGACLHLGISNPKQRMESLIESSRSKLIVCDEVNAGKVNALGRRIVVVDKLFVDSLITPTAFSLRNIQPHNAAFVIFTSGSTGAPKGIVLEHASLCTSCESFGSRMGIGPGTRILQFAAYTFDVSTADILFSIMRGAKLKANWLFLTPSVASAVDSRSFSTVKTLLLGGEAPTHKNISDWAERASLHMDLQQVAVRGLLKPDNHEALSPLGCIGELCVEGRTVARGYLGDEFKTQTSFIEDPSWLPLSQQKLHPRRIHKTGDLVRYNSDGSISFIGRKDRQVKIRGQRVELGEIEYQISHNVPGVNQVVVCPMQNWGPKTGEALVAFLARSQGFDTSNMEVNVGDFDSQMLDILRGARDKLSSKLPTYMLPRLYVPVTSIPSTANGKLDVVYLKDIMSNISESQLVKFSLVQDSGSSEQPIENNAIALQSMWASILGLTEHDIESGSNFFLLGGDSIKAIQLAEEARNKGYSSLTVSSILEHPSLLEMASNMNENNIEVTTETIAEVAPFSLLPILYSSTEDLIQQCASMCHVNGAEIEDIYPCSPTQEAIFSFSMRNPGSYIINETYRLGSDVNVYDFKEAWETMLAENDILRTRIIFSESYGFLQVVMKRRQIIWNESATQMSLSINSGSPLAKFGIIQTTQESSTAQFLITLHHALCDGFSLPLLLETAAKIYYGKIYTPLTPFKNYIQYLSTRIQLESESAKFWEQRLQGSQTLTWPTSVDSPPEKESTKIVKASVQFPEKAMQRPSDFTLSEIIQSAFSLLLGQYTRSSDVTFGLTISGRDVPLPSILEINGPTLVTVPMRVTWDQAQSVQKLVMGMRHEKAAMINHQHMGLSKIRQCRFEMERVLEIKTMLVIQALNEPSDDQKRMQTRLSTSEIVASYPLTLECQIVNSNSVDIIAEFDSRAIGLAEIERFTHQLGHLIV
ncbi:uncharacterized protein TRUGW13939_02607 [Talaromyces rugulosus]|uniref:Carrier domain-containing protein n=1 Tax=Talaromyces rugulosus TaxID=121627 RepID=A0A7H8QNI9_TALRU|nr:uncharacterized protein TRUGW13939_02607 [Talaromyces rugulosus]QKX55514.1 hypothetical protein TRUGW13939_02607 [Talaromyces rugulosus]